MKKLLFGAFLAVLLVASAMAYPGQVVRLSASQGDIEHLGWFSEFATEKIDVSGWARMPSVTENGRYTGTMGMNLLGITTGGNRVTLNLNAKLLTVQQVADTTIYVYEGMATFKSGKLFPERKFFQVALIQNTTSGQTALEGYSEGLTFSVANVNAVIK